MHPINGVLCQTQAWQQTTKLEHLANVTQFFEFIPVNRHARKPVLDFAFRGPFDIPWNAKLKTSTYLNQ